MTEAFDHIAMAYDDIFTMSATGQLQRDQVRIYLDHAIPQLKGSSMLELNCGTGEDAVWFAARGFNVVATDVSHEMLKVTQRKVQHFSLGQRVTTQRLDLGQFDEAAFDSRFDLVFSNFGGLNCIDPDTMSRFFRKLPDCLNPGGRFIGVIMPKFCAWEALFFLYKFRFGKAFRRLTSGDVMANLHGVSLKTWYYFPSDIRNRTAGRFNLVALKPVGIALPPSYLESFFRSRQGWLARLNALERKMSATSRFSAFADHFIIDLELR
jgi:ubiquinone/menaquinone biosynthesis C-methylase UbiE